MNYLVCISALKPPCFYLPRHLPNVLLLNEFELFNLFSTPKILLN